MWGNVWPWTIHDTKAPLFEDKNLVTAYESFTTTTQCWWTLSDKYIIVIENLITATTLQMHEY